MHIIQKHMFLVPLTAVILFLTACDRNPKEGTAPIMTALTPRLQPVFEKTKTVCFGRFMVDVPASAIIVWGGTDIPLGVTVYPDGFDKVIVLAQKFIDELKSEKAIYLNDVPLLISVDEVSQPEGKVVAGFEGFEAISELKINGYFRLNSSGVIIDSRPLSEEKEETIADIKGIARRLRQRADTDIPSEPGNCIEYAFLPDKPGTENEPRTEIVRIGVRLKEFPDTHLSISLRPSNLHKNESNSLKWQLERLEKNLKIEDPNHPRLKTKYFRRGSRQIHDWVDGFEALSKSPEQAQIHGIHDFGMDFPGVPHDPFKPFVDIRMQTGVANNAAGAAKPSLTDEEAIAVWDKITSTIRVRPTGAATVENAGVSPQPRFPLGELAATGRTCPQTGMWQSSDPSNIADGQRRYFKEGNIMPRVTMRGEPTLWQKFKGERPVHSLATVWKLVGYDDLPAPGNKAAQMSTIARVDPEPKTVNDPTGDSIDDRPNRDTLSKEKG